MRKQQTMRTRIFALMSDGIVIQTFNKRLPPRWETILGEVVNPNQMYRDGLDIEPLGFVEVNIISPEYDTSTHKLDLTVSATKNDVLVVDGLPTFTRPIIPK